MNGWFEEYGCGCMSNVVRRKADLLGYCGKHGDSRRNLYRDTPDYIDLVKRTPPESTRFTDLRQPEAGEQSGK